MIPSVFGYWRNEFPYLEIPSFLVTDTHISIWAKSSFFAWKIVEVFFRFFQKDSSTTRWLLLRLKRFPAFRQKVQKRVYFSKHMKESNVSKEHCSSHQDIICFLPICRYQIVVPYVDELLQKLDILFHLSTCTVSTHYSNKDSAGICFKKVDMWH